MTPKSAKPTESPAPTEPEKELDSLGQDNPARALERKTIKEAAEKQAEADKNAQKAEKEL